MPRVAHAGRLPFLVAQGYGKAIFATAEQRAGQNAREQMQPSEAGDFWEAEDGCRREQAQRFFEREAVDRSQQAVHDLYIDTTWPARPLHPNHPLWQASARLSADVSLELL